MTNAEFRRELQRIVDTYKGDDVGKQIPLIAELARVYPHSVKLKQEAVPGDPLTFRYTCFQYAFELIESPVVKAIARRHEEIFPSPEYVTFLIDSGVLIEILHEDTFQGGTIVYFYRGKPAHAGKIRSGRVISKWGLMHLWEHGIDEVPAKYGNVWRFFAKIPRELAVESFVKYAGSKGVRVNSSSW